ncbi:ergothioneine biosynthesis protein EgtB [Candidatus Gracilibacteria bacterium]|nr:ergothioneine biosynthesis protein EgtB [Candidatus Gracilibacteria bacterium]NJM88309.1 ergothioneine biosynthesis protein EgtB [Hydrococcus sp. RU_2_2]NJP18039.1 ergothioneine biosynthesis protein EgtB [Hydrococcus sp. CRU_1_1]
MKFASIQSRREEIADILKACRSRTLDLFTDIDSETFCKQAHPDFSPVGWHLGHIAFTEAYWILESCMGLPPLLPQYRTLFAADGLPKSQRQFLPSFEVIYEYLDTVRTQVLSYLETAPLEKQERLWRWLIQHESQHSEIIAFILQLRRWNRNGFYTRLNFSQSSIVNPPSPSPEMVEIPAGECEMGYDAIAAQDNERPTHQVYLDTYWLDRYPVTCAQYREFMAAGGYQNERFWSVQGWKWLEANPVCVPLYWSDSSDWDNHPVCGVSWYEAQAYARFVGKRLPTEAEWEKAASWNAQNSQKSLYPWGNSAPNPKLCNHNCLVGHTTPVNAYLAGQSAYGCCDMLGNVWEWTDSWFAGYEGFQPYPYRGYSQTYFDTKHRVLRGGSWATRSWAMRSSFRNWYHPGVRQILAGFRCAR